VFAIGGGNFVWGGNGNDELQAIGAGNVFVAGDGNNRMTALGGGNVFIGAGGDDNAFMAGMGNVFIAGGGNNVAFMMGMGNFMQGGSGDDKAIGIGAIGNAFILGDGNNTVGALGGSGNIIWTGKGNDTVVSIAPEVGNLLLLGDGDNFAMAAGTANVVIAGSGRDSVLTLGQYNIVSTASGNDHVIALGQTNLVHTGGDDDFAFLVGKTNFLDTGWGNDIAVAIGQNNIVLTEAGNDTALVIGQSNYVFAGSGDDIVAAFGQSNYVLTGSGADIVLVFGKKNIVATDNEIVITEDDLPIKESSTVKGFSDKGKDWSKSTGLDISTQAELKISGDLTAYFPDIEFSSANQPDWKMPTVTLPQFNYQLPSMPQLKSAPSYEYGTVGNYGLPNITLPMLSSPELQIPGITIPSFSIPDIVGGTSVKLDSIKLNFYLDFNVSSDWAGVLGSSFSDLVGRPQTDGNSNKLLGTKLNVQPSVSGNANLGGVDLTGKGKVSETSSVNVIVADAESKNKAEAQVKTVDPSASAYGTTYANASVWDTSATNDQKWAEGAPMPGAPSSASAKKVRYLMLMQPSNGAWDPAELTVMSGGKNVALGKTVYVGNQGAAEPSANLVDGNAGSYYHDEYRYGSIPKNQWVMVDLGQEFTLDSITLTSRTGWEQRESNVKVYQSEKNFLTTMGLTPCGSTSNGSQMSDEQVANLDKGLYSDTKLLQVANQNEQLSVSRNLTGTTYQLPSFSFDDIVLPNFNLDGFNMSGYSQLLGDVFSGRDFFGVTLPSFSIPDFKAPIFSLNDYVADGATNALTIKGRSFQLPSLQLPAIAGLNITSRLPIFSNFDFHHGSGDTAIVGGEENRVMTGTGDDLAFVAGQTNTLIMGDGNDAALMFGQKNNFRGGAGADVVLAGGSENNLKGQDDNDLLIALGLTNKLDGGSGDDALIAVGNTNELDGGAGKDLMIAIGNENKFGCKADTTTGDGNDTIIALGLTNKINAGKGDDWVLAVGLENTIDLGEGNDLACVVGWSNTVIGDSSDADNGADTILVSGGKNNIQGNGGNDLLLVAGLANRVDAGNGNDVVVTAGLGQFINLGDGNDIDVALGAGNVVTGGLGDDVIYVAGLLNTVFAGDGNDVMFAFGGGSVLNGGAGSDVYLSQGIASRVLQSKGLLNDATTMIQTALDALNGGTQSICSETAPDQVSNYQNQQGTGFVNDVSGNGNNVFYSGFEKTVVDAGSGDDCFHFYLGDGDMTVNSGSGCDKLYIHADVNEYASFGLKTNIGSSDLYYQASSKTLSIYRNNVSYGRIILTDFGSNDTLSLLTTGGQSMDVLLSSLQAPAGTQSNTQYWAPTMPTQTGPYFNPDLTTLYDQMQSALKINSAVL
jgi:hypothetical protein